MRVMGRSTLVPCDDGSPALFSSRRVLSWAVGCYPPCRATCLPLGPTGNKGGLTPWCSYCLLDPVPPRGRHSERGHPCLASPIGTFATKTLLASPDHPTTGYALLPRWWWPDQGSVAAKRTANDPRPHAPCCVSTRCLYQGNKRHACLLHALITRDTHAPGSETRCCCKGAASCRGKTRQVTHRMGNLRRLASGLPPTSPSRPHASPRHRRTSLPDLTTYQTRLSRRASAERTYRCTIPRRVTGHRCAKQWRRHGGAHRRPPSPSPSGMGTGVGIAKGVE